MRDLVGRSRGASTNEVRESLAKASLSLEDFAHLISPAAIELLEAMSRDKKNQGGRLWLVLPRAIGRVELTDAAGEADVRAVLAAL